MATKCYDGPLSHGCLSGTLTGLSMETGWSGGGCNPSPGLDQSAIPIQYYDIEIGYRSDETAARRIGIIDF